MTERSSTWFVLPEDAEDDMAHLQRAVGDQSWAVFADARLDPEAAPPIALAIAKSSDGRLICTGLIVGLNEAYPLGHGRWGEPVEVTSRDLRGIPVAEMIGKAIHEAPRHHRWAARLVEGRADVLPSMKRAPGPKGHPDEHFRAVAEMYRRALAEQPKAPVAWMATTLSADRSTISRWLQRARDKGYLGEANPGRAGERAGGVDQ